MPEDGNGGGNGSNSGNGGNGGSGNGSGGGIGPDPNVPATEPEFVERGGDGGTETEESGEAGD